MKKLALASLLLLLAFAPAVLSAQDDKLAGEANKLIERIAKRPEKAWDYAFALRRMSETEEGSKLVATFEKELENDSEAVRMVCSQLVALYGTPELAYEAWGNLLAKGGDEQVDMMSMKAEERKRSYEAQLTEKIEDQNNKHD